MNADTEPTGSQVPATDPAPDDTPAQSTRRDAKAWRPANVLTSFVHATDGVTQTFRAERNFRFHCALATLVVLAALALHLSPLRLAALCFAIGLVLSAELLNTAIEATVDLAMPERHPLAKRAKDAAAGAVLVAAIAAVGVGVAVFLPALLSLWDAGANPRIVITAGIALLVVALLIAGIARLRLSKPGTTKDIFRRTVIGIGLVAYAASLGFRMAGIVEEANRSEIERTVYNHYSRPRPGLLFPGGVP